jgi:hypothetical protein
MPQVQLGDFEQRVWGRLDGNQAFYPQAEIDRLINEGVRVLNLFTGFSQQRVSAGVTILNWQFYRVPAPITIPMEVYVNEQQLKKSSIQQINGANPKWLRGQVKDFTGRWVPFGTQMFAIVGPPVMSAGGGPGGGGGQWGTQQWGTSQWGADGVGGGGSPPTPGLPIEVWGISTPALLVNSTDTLTLDDGYAELITEYAYRNLVMKESGKVFADASAGYQNWLKRAKELQHWQAKINPRFWVEVRKETEAA